jgi:hypothetical protein
MSIFLGAINKQKILYNVFEILDRENSKIIKRGVTEKKAIEIVADSPQDYFYLPQPKYIKKYR